MNDLKWKSMTLNIMYDLPPNIWNKISVVYAKMDGWIGFCENDEKGQAGIPFWYSYDVSQKHISASVEPSGLVFGAKMKTDEEWIHWCEKFKEIATEILGFKVGEMASGEVGHEIEWIVKN